MDDITIFHNPACSKSRRVLELLRDRGQEPTILEYLNEPLTVPRLKSLLAGLNVPLRTVLRESAEAYGELGLAEDKWSDEELLTFMVQHPTLINRPIVVTPLGARLCRPEEVVYDILPR